MPQKRPFLEHGIEARKKSWMAPAPVVVVLKIVLLLRKPQEGDCSRVGFCFFLIP